MTKIAFLDRDGTLNHEVNYLHTWDKFRWIDGAKDALAYLKEKQFVLAVVTNQSGIARGYYDSADVHQLHQKMNDDLFASHRIRIDHFQICPHHPDYTGACKCRKPAIGMLTDIMEQYPTISKSDSIMVGDKKSDYEAGRKADITAYRVLTGYGETDLLFPGITLKTINELRSYL